MSFYILQDKDEFDTGLPMGYSIIQADKDSAPEGVKLLNEKQLDKELKDIETNNEKLIEALANDKPISIKDKYTIVELKKLAAKHKIKGRSKMKEKQLMKALLEAEVKL